MEHRQSRHSCCPVPVLLSNGWINRFLRVSGKHRPIHFKLSLEYGNGLKSQCRVRRLSQWSLEQESLGTKSLHQSLKETSLIPIPFPKVPGSSVGW